MIKHVVLWRLRSTDPDTRGEAMASIRSALASQVGAIPGLLRVEVGESFGTGRRLVDFALVCEFESRDALAAYHSHPKHYEVRAIVDPLIAEHWIADYEA